jgi:protein-S-isoprenylcysteine O-methyltransferase Ste14
VAEVACRYEKFFHMKLPGQRLLIAITALGVVLIFAANSLFPASYVLKSGHAAYYFIGVALLLMVMAVLALGSLLFQPGPGDRLVTGGIYRYCRHPFYLGLILGFTGLALSTNNWLAVAAALLLILPAQILRSLKEEQALHHRFGEAWEAYQTRSYFMIPLLW